MASFAICGMIAVLSGAKANRIAVVVSSECDNYSVSTVSVRFDQTDFSPCIGVGRVGVEIVAALDDRRNCHGGILDDFLAGLKPTPHQL